MNYRMIVIALSVLSLSAGCAHRKPNAEESAAYTKDPAPTSSTPDGGISADDVATLHRNFRRVLFDFDTATLTEGARAALKENAEILVSHPGVAVRIEGHTDHFGSDEYNLALGQRRAQSVNNYLLSMDVPESQLQLISYGREKTLVPPSTVEAEAPNRRAEFMVMANGEGLSSSDIDDMTFHIAVEQE